MARRPLWSAEAAPPLSYSRASGRKDADIKAEALPPHSIAYDAVIRPFDALLAHCDQVIVVADRSLRDVAFAALYDASTKRYLVERMAVSTAMSASALRPLPARAAGSLLAVALPSDDAAGLPETRTEVADVQSMYAKAVTVAPSFAAFVAAAPDAQVIHIAGHTQKQSGNDGNVLLFGRDRVTWRAIADRRLPRTPVVVLAACETLSANAGSMTLGDGFLAAGATDVIGTLTPIADADARELFHAIHRRLAAGDTPSAAVRAAQVEAICPPTDAWRAIVSLTEGFTREREKELIMTVTVQFVGICTHLNALFGEQKTHRVVLVRADNGAFLNRARIPPHVPKLRIDPKGITFIDGYPYGLESTGAAGTWLIRGVFFSLEGTKDQTVTRVEKFGRSTLRSRSKPVDDVERVAACYFDFTGGTLTSHKPGAAFEAVMTVKTTPKPVLVVQCFWNREVARIGLRPGATITIEHTGFQRGDSDKDFLLHYLVFPSVPKDAPIPPEDKSALELPGDISIGCRTPGP
jgi:hypothetical protein